MYHEREVNTDPNYYRDQNEVESDERDRILQHLH